MHPLEIFHKYGGAEAEEDGQIGWLLGSSCEMWEWLQPFALHESQTEI